MGEPYIGRQYYLNHIGDIYSAWSLYRGKGIKIAVIDKGFAPRHEDFINGDGLSKIDPLSASFVTNGNATTTEVGIDKVEDLGDSHGSFCAGVAAASLNGRGVIGVAPEAELLLLRTDGKPKSIAKAFHYAADNGAKVVSISIGSYYNYRGDLVDDGSDLSTVFNEPVSYCRNKGTAIISAAGNGGLEGIPHEYTFPGASKGVIGAGGLEANSSTEIWEGTSYNSSPEYAFADVFAPANGMFGICHYDNKLYDGGWNGTSFASPIVAGAAALYFEKNPTSSVDQFEADLYASCIPLNESSCAEASQLGHGRLDIGKLLGIASSSKEVSIKVNATSPLYCYAWDKNSNKELAPWPGRQMNKEGDAYTLNLSLGDYSELLFTYGSEGPQTVDILASSFLYGKAYDLRNPASENNRLIGNYV